MRYKVGDRVVVRKAKPGESLIDYMYNVMGKEVTITEIVIGLYRFNDKPVVLKEDDIDHEATAKLKEDKMKTYNLIEVMNSEEGTRFKKVDSENVYYICGEHLFVEFSTGGRGSCVCTKEIVGAQFTLVQPKINLSDDEKIILRNIDPEYEWIAVDKDCTVWLYNETPNKSNDCFGTSGINSICAKFTFNHLFHQLTFENSPHLIADLIKE